MAKNKNVDDEEAEVDLSNIKSRRCDGCGNWIPPYRIYCVPDTLYCVSCAEKYGPQRVIDPEEVCAKSSPSGQNGFSPKS